MNDNIKRDEPSDQDKLTMLVGYLASGNSVWDVCEQLIKSLPGGVNQMFDEVVASTKENCDEPGELLEILGHWSELGNELSERKNTVMAG